MIRKFVTKEKAMERLQVLCNRSEHCEYDLNKKLLNWGINSLDCRDIIEWLKDNRLVDNTRFAKAFANDKARFSSWGPQKIRLELLRRRISPAVITEALQLVENSVWKEGLIRCAKAKSKNLDLTGQNSWTDSRKLYQYLLSRGFPSAAVSKVVTLMKNKQEEEDE